MATTKTKDIEIAEVAKEKPVVYEGPPLESVDIKWAKKKDNLCQAYSNGLEFAWCSEKLEQVGDFVFCKDYLQDAICGILLNQKLAIYGYVYDPATMPIMALDAIRILIGHRGDKAMSGKLEAAMEFLHQFEDELGFKRTVFQIVNDPPNVFQKSGIYLLTGDERWLLSSPLISLYSLLIRVGFVHTKGRSFRDTINDIVAGKLPPYCSQDTSYLKSSKVGIDHILKVKDVYEIFGKDIKKNYHDTMRIHNSGIVHYASVSTKGADQKAWAKKHPGHDNYVAAVKPYCDHWQLAAIPDDYVSVYG